MQIGTSRGKPLIHDPDLQEPGYKSRKYPL